MRVTSGIFFDARLKSTFKNIWAVGGGKLAGACLRADIADEIRYSILPVLIGKGIPFFEGLDYGRSTPPP